MFKAAALFLSALFVLFTAPPAYAQAANIDKNVLRHAATIASICPGKWKNDKCLKAVSLSNKDMAIKYAAMLNAKGQKDQVEAVKQVCAAATVTQDEIDEDIPAYAFASAYTECANGIFNISEKSKVKPDQYHYGLLIGAVQCLNKTPECSLLEAQMTKSYKR